MEEEDKKFGEDIYGEIEKGREEEKEREDKDNEEVGEEHINQKKNIGILAANNNLEVTEE